MLLYKTLGSILSRNPHQNPPKWVFLALSSQKSNPKLGVIMLPWVTEAGMSRPGQCGPDTAANPSVPVPGWSLRQPSPLPAPWGLPERGS